MKTRHAVLGVWGLSGISMLATGTVAAGGAGSGLLAPTVCVSPLVFLFAVATPPETLADIARQRFEKVRDIKGGADTKDNREN